MRGGRVIFQQRSPSAPFPMIICVHDVLSPLLLPSKSIRTPDSILITLPLYPPSEKESCRCHCSLRAENGDSTYGSHNNTEPQQAIGIDDILLRQKALQAEV